MVEFFADSADRNIVWVAAVATIALVRDTDVGEVGRRLKWISVAVADKTILCRR